MEKRGLLVIPAKAGIHFDFGDHWKSAMDDQLYC